VTRTHVGFHTGNLVDRKARRLAWRQSCIKICTEAGIKAELLIKMHAGWRQSLSGSQRCMEAGTEADFDTNMHAGLHGGRVEVKDACRQEWR